MSITIRAIDKNDNQGLAKIIRCSLEEFQVPKIGTVYSDPTTDNLYSLFSIKGSSYFVAEENGVLLGGCGIYPTPGLEEGYTELVKLYLSPSARGKGLGRQLLEICFKSAKEFGYKKLYLESFLQLEKAVNIYLKFGFYHIDHALGNSGHPACSIWMIKDLTDTA